jgi:hypothetical protein
MASSFTDDTLTVPGKPGVALEPGDTLYRHTKRPQWGVAILAWEKEDVRAYQFEDGRLRKFKKGYYNLMKEVDEVRGSEENLINDLQDAVVAKGGRQEKRDPLRPVATFDEQIALFEEMYPEGFADEQWIDDHRGTESGRDLKRHREPVIEAVKENLSLEICQELIDDDRHGDLVEAALEILASTDLVSLKHVRMLQGLDPEENKKLAEGIFAVLHGEGDFRARMQTYLEGMTEILGSRPSWRLATALPALAFPDDQVCVRRSAFKRQAGSIAPRSKYSRFARMKSYENYRRVAVAVRKRLQAAGHEPRDLLDVHDFIWATLRNAALDHLGDD